MPQDGCLCIYANSTGLSEYDTNLSLSGTGYQISRIKSSYKLFCALIYNLPNFFQNSNFLPFLVRFLRYFCTYFDTDNDYYAVTIMKGNFDGSCKTSYNVLSHSHRDWIKLCLSEVRVGGRGCRREGCLYHLPQISGHSGRDVNGKLFLVCPTGKFPGQTEILKRLSRFPKWNVPNGNSFTIYKFLEFRASFML